MEMDTWSRDEQLRRIVIDADLEHGRYVVQLDGTRIGTIQRIDPERKYRVQIHGYLWLVETLGEACESAQAKVMELHRSESATGHA